MSYEPHPLLPAPDDETVLWRYMDFPRFVSLLDSAAIFFSAAANLGDSFEGSLTKQNIAARYENLSGFPPENAAEANDYLARINRERKRFIFVSCWHASSFESAAMWAQYAAIDRGIAIKTSFAGLTSSLHPDPIGGRETQIHAALVKYVDYEAVTIEEGNVFFPYVYKRTSFAHERELRLLFYSWPIVGEPGNQHLDHSLPSPPGVYVPVDLSKLVEAVHVAPQTPGWIHDLVRSVLKKYGVDKPVLESSLSGVPLY